MKTQAVLLLLVLSCSSSFALSFYFAPSASPTKCLTVPHHSNSDFQTLSVAACTNSAYQRFLQVPAGPTLEVIITGTSTAGSNLCLDVAGGTENGVPVVQANCNIDRLTQYWVPTSTNTSDPANHGYYWYQNFVTGRCMDESEHIPGQAVVQWHCTPHAFNQLWRTTADPSISSATIKNKRFDNCLEVTGGNGAHTHGKHCVAGNIGQHFDVEGLDVQTFTIQGSGSCLDGGVLTSPQQTYQDSCVSTAANQQWILAFFPNEGDVSYWYLQNLLSGLCLTWDPTNLAKVVTSTCVQGNPTQTWFLTLA